MAREINFNTSGEPGFQVYWDYNLRSGSRDNVGFRSILASKYWASPSQTVILRPNSGDSYPSSYVTNGALPVEQFGYTAIVGGQLQIDAIVDSIGTNEDGTIAINYHYQWNENGSNTVEYIAHSIENFYFAHIRFNPALSSSDFTRLTTAGNFNDLLEEGVRVQGNPGSNILLLSNYGEYIQGGELLDIIDGRGGNDTIIGARGADKLYGGEGDDVVEGYDGADLLVGGPGSDTLVGGLGNDIFVFDVAPVNGVVDQIDFNQSGNDAIRLVRGAFGQLALGRLPTSAFRDIGAPGAEQDADDFILYDSATGALFYDADGRGGAAALQFARTSPYAGLTASSFTVVDRSSYDVISFSDLGGDGTSDILFQSGSSVVSWRIENGQAQASDSLGNAGIYTAAATGDFNGDGTADVLFQNNDSIVAWEMNNGRVTSGPSLGSAGSYTAVAAGDFDGDGTDDVVFQQGGSVVAWQMQNGQVQSSIGLGNAGGYQVVGTGDLNGDGTDDIVFQSGASVIAWVMGSGQVQSVADLGNAGTYQVAGIGDLNGDGRADLVFQSGASVVDWIMGSKAQVQSANGLGNAGGYTVSGVGDYNGDGTADVLFQQGSSVVAWQVQNGQVQSLLNLGNAGSYTAVA